MTLNPRRALIVIDVQNDYVTGNLPIEYPDVACSLVNIARAMDAACAQRIPSIVVQNTSPVGSPIFAKGTSGWELHDIIRTRQYSHYIEKNLPSAFAGTDLSDWLKQEGIDTLTVAGFMTHNCDDSTIKHAMHAGLAVEFLSDASGAVPYVTRIGQATAEEIHRVFTVVMQTRFAAVASTDEWIAALKSQRALPRDNIYASNQRARRLVSVPHESNTTAPTILLRLLAEKDRGTIEQWPPYPFEFEGLDYALRKGGWLDEFCDKTEARCFIAEESGEPIAFTILAKTGEYEAEMRVALRADKTGLGLGRNVTTETLARGFGELGLSRIHLIVRKNNQRAIHLYQRLGFDAQGECCKIIKGHSVQFQIMSLLRCDYARK